jgi:hypothetical protein
MSEFVSRPPSEKPSEMANFFQGGLMPAAPSDVAALIVLDIRSLNLSAEQGRELESAVREFVFDQLEKRYSGVDLSDRSAIDLSSSVFGIAIE